MRYSIEPRERRYVKGYGFLSFARNIGTHAAKVAKNMSNKYSQKLVDSAKRAIQKTAEVTGDLIGNKIADKITSASKKSQNEVNNEMPKERYISPKERQKIIDELRLI